MRVEELKQGDLITRADCDGLWCVERVYLEAAYVALFVTIVEKIERIEATPGEWVLIERVTR